MKIKYRVSDGLITAWGRMLDLQPGVGEAVEDTQSEADLTGKIRTGQDTFRDKSQAEKDAQTDADKKFTKARVVAFVNAGATQQDKFDRLLKVVAVLAQNVREADVS